MGRADAADKRRIASIVRPKIAGQHAFHPSEKIIKKWQNTLIPLVFLTVRRHQIRARRTHIIIFNRL
jgi:hypothetical protein